jgi:hypothetical protein
MNYMLWQGYVNVPPMCPTKWLFLTLNPVVSVRSLTPLWNNLTVLLLTSVLFERCAQNMNLE